MVIVKLVYPCGSDGVHEVNINTRRFWPLETRHAFGLW